MQMGVKEGETGPATQEMLKTVLSVQTSKLTLSLLLKTAGCDPAIVANRDASRARTRRDQTGEAGKIVRQAVWQPFCLAIFEGKGVAKEMDPTAKFGPEPVDRRRVDGPVEAEEKSLLEVFVGKTRGICPSRRGTGSQGGVGLGREDGSTP